MALVLTRTVGRGAPLNTLVIERDNGEKLTVTLTKIKGVQVVVAIDAPERYSISRQELLQREADD